ncbi:MAG: PorT family protein [Bacteroidales bacterium]|jgi:opacity protein-like surface antigen|nr:PorT family protein [Bacteroidales bacterium]MDD3736301.1 outer membrane beta-barrel protein [Bacteroidales bacterium]HNT92138.1 outer membrane beta-barrel protein [Bacteroidales bacterium]HOO65598.1 outer membrane beta-barrel protein [Bacteroidales bacterium]HPE21569.1 outer membrane beta-barrel protein [Bacteroidales bacterium]
MKKFIVIILALVLAAPLYSQVKFGIKAGASTDFTFTDQTFQGTNFNVILQNAKDAEWGFQGGVFMRASFSGFYIQPELLLATATNSVTYEDVEAGGAAEIYSQKFNKLNIPVLLGVKVGPLRLNAGPAASVMITDPKEIIEGATYKRATFGYQAGVGFDLLKRLSFDLRYEGNLNQFGDEIEIGDQTFNLDDRTGAILVHVGLMF